MRRKKERKSIDATIELRLYANFKCEHYGAH